MKKFLVLLFIAMQLNAVAQVQTPKYVSMIANSNGYYECLPNDYNNAGNQAEYPLILFIHGIGELGNGSPAQLPKVLVNGPPKLINQGNFPASFTVGGQTYSFIVISPQFINWPTPADIYNVLNYLESTYRINSNRIYLTGLSMGGGTVWNYAGYNSTYANRLAAIIPICGASSPSVFRANVIAAANLPVWATHNLNDPTCPVSFTNDYINYIENAPVPSSIPPKKSIFNASGHDAWSKTYDPNWKEDGTHNVYEWLLMQHRGNIILPVTLSSYTATATTPGKVTIAWTTTQEQNNSYFTIEKSTDGVSFYRIGQVQSANLPSGNSYSYIDNLPLPGINFYRLSQTDINGKTTFYDVKKITIENGNTESIVLYPNPVKETLVLELNLPQTGTISANIFQADGKLVKQIQFNKPAGYIRQQFDVRSLPSGYYTLEVRGINFKKAIPFVKK